MERGYIYILKTEGSSETLYKVGYTKSYEKRLSTYVHHNPFIKEYLLYRLDNKYAKIIESNIHNRYASKYKNEWYSKESVDKIVEYINSFNIYIEHFILEKDNEQRLKRKKKKMVDDYEDIVKPKQLTESNIKLYELAKEYNLLEGWMG